MKRFAHAPCQAMGSSDGRAPAGLARSGICHVTAPATDHRAPRAINVGKNSSTYTVQYRNGSQHPISVALATGEAVANVG